MGGVFKDRLLLALTLVLNWIIGPFLMFFLSIGFFHQSSPRFMSGLSLVRRRSCAAKCVSPPPVVSSRALCRWAALAALPWSLCGTIWRAVMPSIALPLWPSTRC
jgi:hypothetical protein